MARISNMWKVLFGVTIGLGVLYYRMLPSELFNDPYSTVLEDRHGELLAAAIAKDGQWRFPPLDSVPEKFAKALVLYEDKRFMSHPGIDMLALGRAVRENLKAGRIVSGGSTLTMQVTRLSLKGNGRTYVQKIKEMLLATRLEFRYSKDQIMAMYASHAPFGGNVVGLEAACWRYFGRDMAELSWAEAAMLAVLPNAPALIHPGRNREILLARRNNLLDRLRLEGVIDAFTCELAKSELIPDEPAPLPRYARHVLQRVMQEGYTGQRVASTIDWSVQRRVEELVQEHHRQLSGNQIHNAAALVLEVETGNVLAYVGNISPDGPGSYGEEVDVVMAPRSTGSILKPFLFAAMLEEGKMLTGTLLPDVPAVINGFAPKNFSREFDGAVPADKALIRSLNVPAVQMLRQYRYEKFYSLLKRMGMTTLTRFPDHYGLSLILGGAEGRLWDLTGMYASMGRMLNHYSGHHGAHLNHNIHPPVYRKGSQPVKEGSDGSPVLSAGAVYQTLDVLQEVYRPGEESGWRNFHSSKKIAWKTGTSFGYRDGWSIGVTPEYAVGVWVGNASGEGRPGLTGTETAAPIMFDIFSVLPGNAWFQLPAMDMDQIAICSVSGMRLSPRCESPDTVWVTARGVEAGNCTYHKRIYVTADRQYRVHSDCESLTAMNAVNWFVLPPVQEHYYRAKNVSYKTLPPLKPGCSVPTMLSTMELIYPKTGARVYIPRDLNGEPGSSVFELAHHDMAAAVHWHLDGHYLGHTVRRHRMAVNPGEGKHTLVLVDQRGDVLERQFEVISN